VTVSRSAQVHAAAERLRAAQHGLRQRTAREVVQSLCRVFDLWRSADSTYAKALETELPGATGFGPEMIREGLRLGLEGWSGDAFRHLVHAELGDTDRLDDASSEPVRGFEPTSVLLAGSIPMPSLLAMLLPLVLRSTVLVKTASRDPVTPRLVADSLASVDPRLAHCIEVVEFERADAEAARAFFASPCIVATGSDETLAQVRRLVAPSQRFVQHGHRMSIAVLGPEALDASSRRGTAERVSLDIALWDQLGCLSPLVIFVVAPSERAAASEFGAALARALEDAEARWPRGAIEPEAAAAIASQRSEAQMRASLGRNVQLHASEGTSWTVVVEDDASVRPSPLHRFVRVVPVRSIDALRGALAPYGSHLAGVALAGFGDEEAMLARALLSLGASRVCAPGRLQAPPLDWPRDNQTLLLSMARLGRVDG